MLYNYSEVRQVHLEVTDLCNASCPMCPRNISGGEDNPLLSKSQLSLNDIKIIFKQEFIRQLDSIFMCGNYGDAITAKDTKEIFSYFYQSNSKIKLSLHTNGGARTPEWWSELPIAMGKNHDVIFGIDGLEDTNHIYRQGVNWNKLIANVQEFIKYGGNASWEFLVFEHNEHQVEEAEKLSKKIGFKRFRVKKSSRFIFSRASGIQAYNKSGQKTNIIKPPKNEKYLNSAAKDLNLEIAKNLKNHIHIMDNGGKFETIKSSVRPQNKEHFNHMWDTIMTRDSAEISCRVSKNSSAWGSGSIFVSSKGYILPCCWIGAEMYNIWHGEKGSQIWDLINEIGLISLDAKINDLETIINGKFFQELVPNSWNKKSCAEGKLLVCARTCDKNYNVHGNQWN
jgi:MoaA/NifB/PqqE/SkfB family radical SAM enzyme